MTVGQKIKTLRTRAGLTQGYVARRLHTTKQTIFKYENGIIINIPMEKIEVLAEVFSVSPAYLLGWEDTMSKEASPETGYIYTLGRDGSRHKVSLSTLQEEKLQKLLELTLPELLSEQEMHL